MDQCSEVLDGTHSVSAAAAAIRQGHIAVNYPHMHGVQLPCPLALLQKLLKDWPSSPAALQGAYVSCNGVSKNHEQQDQSLLAQCIGKDLCVVTDSQEVCQQSETYSTSACIVLQVLFQPALWAL